MWDSAYGTFWEEITSGSFGWNDYGSFRDLSSGDGQSSSPVEWDGADSDLPAPVAGGPNVKNWHVNNIPVRPRDPIEKKD